MKMKKTIGGLLAVVAGVSPFLSLADNSRVTAKSYVKGLLAQWDGVSNDGKDADGNLNAHNASAANWVDLVNGRKFALTNYSGKWGSTYLDFSDGNTYGFLSGTDTDATFRPVSAGGAYEIAITVPSNTSYQCIMKSTPDMAHMIGAKYHYMRNSKSEGRYVHGISSGRNFTATVSVNYWSANVDDFTCYRDTAVTTRQERDNISGYALGGTLLGCRSSSSTSVKIQYPFFGKIYAIRLYDRTLSDTELKINDAIDKVRFYGNGNDISTLLPAGWDVGDDSELCHRITTGTTMAAATAYDDYNVQFDANARVTLSAMPTSGAATLEVTGKKLTLKGNLTVNVPATVVGTYTFAKASQIALASGAKVSVPSSNDGYSCSATVTGTEIKITIARNSYTVTLDAQGGTGGSASVDATYDAVMPAATMPTRTGYTFGGYWSGVGGTGTQFYTAAGTAVTWTRARGGTLYAFWTAKGYPLVLDNGDGTSGSVTATYDKMPPKVSVPEREGMAFLGYFTEPEGAGARVYYPNGIAGEAWTTDGGMTLYAFWQEAGSAESEELTISADLRAVKPAQMFKPEMLVTSPKGWEADAETATILEAIGEGGFVAVVDTVTAPVTVWTPQDVGLYTLKHTTGADAFETAQFNVTGFTYRVEFDANGGTGEAMAGVELAYGAEGTAPECTYTRTDYAFDGWNTRKDGSGDAIAAGGKYSNLVTDASETGTLYAMWKVDASKVIEYTVDVTKGGTPAAEPIQVTKGWMDENLPDVDQTKPAEVKTALETTDPETGLKAWQEYVLDVKPGDKDAKVWIDSPQQKSKDKIKVKMREFSPTKGTGFTVKYRLDTELKGQMKEKGELANSPDFDIDLADPTNDPTGLYTINVVFVPEGKENSDEVVESVNTLGILKVPSPKTLEIVAVPWNRLAPDENQAVLVADLVKTATLTPGDKLHVYDKANKNYKSWSYDVEKGWTPLGTFRVSASGLEQTVAPDQTEQTVARGSAVWLERQDASKPFYLYGQYSPNEVETTVEKNKHNLVACPKMEPFDLNGGGITGTVNANDQIIVPNDGGVPKVYSFRNGMWGYSKIVEVNGIPRSQFVTEGATVPVGTGFWYVSKGGSPVIKW